MPPRLGPSTRAAAVNPTAADGDPVVDLPTEPLRSHPLGGEDPGQGSGGSAPEGGVDPTPPAAAPTPAVSALTPDVLAQAALLFTGGLKEALQGLLTANSNTNTVPRPEPFTGKGKKLTFEDYAKKLQGFFMAENVDPKEWGRKALAFVDGDAATHLYNQVDIDEILAMGDSFTWAEFVRVMSVTSFGDLDTNQAITAKLFSAK